jgi:hypothetical protein
VTTQQAPVRVACESQPHPYDPDKERRSVGGGLDVVEQTCSICGTVRTTVTDVATGDLIARRYSYPAPEKHPELACRTCRIVVMVVDVTNPPPTNICFGPNGPRACNTHDMVRLAKQRATG